LKGDKFQFARQVIEKEGVGESYRDDTMGERVKPGEFKICLYLYSMGIRFIRKGIMWIFYFFYVR
jgi:hypothetical protein